ncbi:MAG TPA: ATP-binding protein [Gemmatimonadaceae bacterium]|nr:ATP-binding protein [Gemmatimonadaceae bacterium]
MTPTSLHGNGNGASPPGRRTATLDVRFPSDVRHIEHVIALVRSQCEAFDFGPHQCSLNIPVALAEALSNAIISGNGEDPSKYVLVRSLIEDDRVIIEVVDEGPGFDLQHSMRDPTRPENLLREDGRGLYLMTHLMNRIERFTGEGNVVRMTLLRDD